MNSRPTSASTVAVLGAGHIGAAVAHTLVVCGTSERVILYDRQRARAEGEAWDIDDTTPLLQEAQVVPTDDYHDLAGADVVVVTVGANMTAGQSRLDVLGENAGIIRSVMGELDRAAPHAAVVITGNPVDVLTRVAIECSARPEHLIMGTGTLLDTARLRYQLATALHVEPADTYVHVLGEHGESQFVAWSTAAIGAIPLAAFPVPVGTTLVEIRGQCEATTRRRGADIHTRKGYTSYGAAAAANRLVSSILRDDGRIFTLSVRALAEYGVGEEVVLGLPCAIGRDGITRRLVLLRDAEEQERLEKSAAVLTDAYRSLK